MEGVMRQSKAEIFLHLVWATWRRAPYLTAEVEPAVYRCIGGELTRLKCGVLAIGGTADHVHLCVRLPTTVAVARLMNQVKGVSSHFVHDRLPGSGHFAWQDGYGAFSVSPDQVGAVVAYIRNQKRHHADARTVPGWEETDQAYVAGA